MPKKINPPDRWGYLGHVGDEQALEKALVLPRFFGLQLSSAQEDRYRRTLETFLISYPQFQGKPTYRERVSALKQLLRKKTFNDRLKRLDYATARALKLTQHQPYLARKKPSTEATALIQERAKAELERLLSEKGKQGPPEKHHHLKRLLEDLIELWTDATGKRPPLSYEKPHAFFPS